MQLVSDPTPVVAVLADILSGLRIGWWTALSSRSQLWAEVEGIVAVKMIAEARNSTRKRAALRRHRRRNWWKVSDTAKVEHLYACKKCYEWVMAEVEASRVRHPAGSWLVSAAIKRERLG